jgi:probable F420-dependent oxidoreductase
VNVSLSVFDIPIGEYAPLAAAVERAGYDAIWIPDHLATPSRIDSTYPYTASGTHPFDRSTPFFDVWVLAAHLATVTSRLRIGTGVFILPLRPAVITARAASTVQHLSGGRFLFGIGTGWMEDEFAATGQSFSDRGPRTDEIIEVIRRLWTGEATSYAGEYVTVPEVTIAPTVPAPIPIVMGGASGPAVRRAAALGDGWYGTPSDLSTACVARDALEAQRLAAGRDGSFTYFVRVPAPYDPPVIESFLATGFEDLVITLAGCGAAASDPIDRKLELIEQAIEQIRTVAG